MTAQISTFFKRLSRYFRAYGGWGAIFGSPLFMFSLFVTAVNYTNWLEDKWSEQSLALIPGLLGFSLGTYAILFSLITTRLKRALKAVTNERQVSYLEEINATFFHFIFVQVVALVWAFLFRATLFTDLAALAAQRFSCATMIFGILYSVGAFTGFLLMVYSLVLIIGAALAVYRLALIVDPDTEQ